MNFVPRNDVVLFRLIKATGASTHGGVALPDNGGHRTVVVAVGPEVDDSIQPGDLVIIGGKADEVTVHPLPLWVDDTSLHCVRERDVMLVVKGDE